MDKTSPFDDYVHQTPSTSTLAEPPAFVEITHKLAKSLEESAQTQFNAASQHLEDAKLFAEQLVNEVRKRAQEQHDLAERIRQFGESVLAAHERFHKETPETPKALMGTPMQNRIKR